MLFLRTLHIVFLILLFEQVSLCQQIPKFNSNSAAAATAYLDFDGQVVKGTAWNWDSTIHAKPASSSSTVINQIFNRVAEDFRALVTRIPKGDLSPALAVHIVALAAKTNDLGKACRSIVRECADDKTMFGKALKQKAR